MPSSTPSAASIAPARPCRSRRCCATRRASAALGVPLTLVVERPDGVEYRRSVVADQGVGGHALGVPLVASAPTGTWRVRAFTDPEASAGRRDELHGRGLCAGSARVRLSPRPPRASPRPIRPRSRSTATFSTARPPSGLELEGEVVIAPATERAGFAGYAVRLVRRGGRGHAPAARGSARDRRQRQGAASRSRSTSCRARPARSRPRSLVRMAEAGGRAVERKLTLPVTPSGPMIGVKPLFSGRSLGEGQNASFDVIVAAPDGKPLARSGLRYELLRIETKYQYYRRDNSWNYEPIKIDQARRRRADRRGADKPGAHRAAGAVGPLPARGLDRRSQRPDHLGRLRCRLVRRRQRRHARHARDRARQARIRAGRQP